MKPIEKPVNFQAALLAISDPDKREDIIERAAILEYEAGLPRDLAELAAWRMSIAHVVLPPYVPPLRLVRPEASDNAPCEDTPYKGPGVPNGKVVSASWQRQHLRGAK